METLGNAKIQIASIYTNNICMNNSHYQNHETYGSSITELNYPLTFRFPFQCHTLLPLVYSRFQFFILPLTDIVVGFAINCN
jgi:hypothetical protein